MHLWEYRKKLQSVLQLRTVPKQSGWKIPWVDTCIESGIWGKTKQTETKQNTPHNMTKGIFNFPVLDGKKQFKIILDWTSKFSSGQKNRGLLGCTMTLERI